MYLVRDEPLMKVFSYALYSRVLNQEFSPYFESCNKIEVFSKETNVFTFTDFFYHWPSVNYKNNILNTFIIFHFCIYYDL